MTKEEIFEIIKKNLEWRKDYIKVCNENTFDYHKGYIEALKWVLQLQKDIVENEIN